MIRLLLSHSGHKMPLIDHLAPFTAPFHELFSQRFFKYGEMANYVLPYFSIITNSNHVLNGYCHITYNIYDLFTTSQASLSLLPLS